MSRPFPNSRRGFTILETVVSLAIAGLLFAALATFFGRGISSNRFQFEHLLTTDAARFQFERMVSDLRLARPGPNGEGWLIGANDYFIQFYANVDSDPGIEQVRYSFAQATLTRTVIEPAGTYTVSNVSDSMRNYSAATPVFRYYGTLEALPQSEVNSDTVVKVLVTMIVDVQERQQPGPLTLSTFVTPRLLHKANDASARLYPVTLNYPSDYTATQLMEVKTTYPGGQVGTQVWPVAVVNGRLTTYDGERVNINYQTSTIESFLPGWYVWVGPILLGESGGQKYYKTEQLQISDICLHQEFAALIVSCSKRPASYGTFNKQYQPLVMYTNGGVQDYVKDITFTYNPNPPPTPTPTPAPVAELAYWKFDEGNSNVGGDSSGHGYTGTMHNGLGSSQGWTSTTKPALNFTDPYALTFDGSKDDMSMSDASGLSLTNNFTFATWIKTSSGTTQMLYSSGQSSSPYNGFQITLSSGKVTMRTSGASTTVSATSSINDNAWHHVAIVVNSSGGLTFYKDGAADGTFALDGSTVHAINAYSGTRIVGESPSGTQNFNGTVDDMRLYNVALTAAEVQFLAQGNDL